MLRRRNSIPKKGTKKTASGNGCSACGGCPEMIHYELLKSGISPEVSAGPVLAHRTGFYFLFGSIFSFAVYKTIFSIVEKSLSSDIIFKQLVCIQFNRIS